MDEVLNTGRMWLRAVCLLDAVMPRDKHRSCAAESGACTSIWRLCL